jgi:transcriptional regulator with XRE-family HTH domain
MSGEVGNPHTGLEIGKTLRRAREKRGLSLQQVEEATKIRTRYLRDLENENFDVLPAVYMLGSLKTYAAHLGLDGMTMTSEVKRRQAPLRAEQERAQEDPPSREPRRFLASLGRLLGISETVEDEAGTMPDPVHSPRLHVSVAVVLVFVLATALVSSLEREEHPSVSQVREPKSSQISSMLALSSNAIVDEPYTEGGNVEYQPGGQARTPARDAGRGDEVDVGGSAQAKYAPRTAQTSSSASALASAPASASTGASGSASPASTEPFSSSDSAPATTTPALTRVRPEPAARKQPDDAGRAKVVALPDALPARAPGGRDLRPGFQRKQAGPVDSTRRGDRTFTLVEVFTRVEKTVSFAR